jgi:UDP:flavonoid glycosyltransferase YjiC (YdhE family)
LSGSTTRDRIEGIGADFHPLPTEADFDFRDPISVVPELKDIPPGPEWLRVACERFFVNVIPAQHHGLQQVLSIFPADVIIADDMMFGVLPMLLGACTERPPIILCGTSFLHWHREDRAPHFAGLPPATTGERRREYAEIAQEHDRIFHQPLGERVNRCLKNLGAGPLVTTLFDSVVELADAYMQLSVPGFEFPRNIPGSVRFVGALPIIPNQAPIPSWAHELDGSRKVVLVTQGTVANHDFGLLIGPALKALENEGDLLVVITAGGRPVSAVPGPIPPNACIASYLPFEWVLPKTDVFVTNGGYGSVNQALSFGTPLVTAGLTEDKADVNARVAWSGAGIDLATNQPTPQALREAIRTVLHRPNFRARASQLSEEFAAIDTRSEILRIVEKAVNLRGSNGLRRGDTSQVYSGSRRTIPVLPA